MKIRMIVYEIFIYMLKESINVLEPVLQNGLDASVTAALQAPVMYAITRGMHKFADGSWRSSSYSDLARYPGNGLRASGDARVKGLKYADRFGLLQSQWIVTTSGCPKPDDPTVPHYGNTFRDDLIRRGVHQNGGAERTLLVQGVSLDTIGEIAILPAFLRSMCANDPNLLGLLQRDGVTIYSSFEQSMRIAFIQAMVGLRANDQLVAQNAIAALKKDLEHNPTIAYVRANVQGIIAMANDSLINQEHAVRALALAHMGPDQICCPTSLQQASDALFAHPRFAPWFAQNTPNLADDLLWMGSNGIGVRHLKAEEIMLYLQKSGHKIGKKLREYWLDHIWHIEPYNNQVVGTFIAELAGAYDMYQPGHYYAQGEKATEKAVHTQLLMEQFGITPPQPHP